MRKIKPTAVSIFLFCCAPAIVLANAWTPFVENLKVGESATHSCVVVSSGFDKEWEYFTVIVHSDTGDVYGLRSRAKPGVVDLDKLNGFGAYKPCEVTAKLL